MKFYALIIGALVLLSACASNDTQTTSSAEAAARYIADGRKYVEKKAYKQAKQKFDAALNLTPDDINLHGLAGTTAMNMGHLRTAMQHFVRITELDPSDYRAYRSIAKVARKLDKYEEAIVAYKKVLSIKPDDLRSTDGIADSYYALKDYKNCEIYMDKFEQLVKEKSAKSLSEKTKASIEHSLARYATYRDAISKS